VETDTGPISEETLDEELAMELLVGMELLVTGTSVVIGTELLEVGGGAELPT
jgi:hypothetical protein